MSQARESEGGVRGERIVSFPGRGGVEEGGSDMAQLAVRSVFWKDAERMTVGCRSNQIKVPFMNLSISGL